MKTHYVLNLDPAFSPFEHSIYNPLTSRLSIFPGGEPHFTLETIADPSDTILTITQRFNKVDDLMLIVIATDAARRAGFKNIRLLLPYFPAARQDRVCNPGESLTLKVFADMINGCNFEEVAIYSPHSEVTPALINNCVELDLDFMFLERIVALEGAANVNIVCPDAGAGKRVGKLAKRLANKYEGFVVNLIRCEKIRDVATGELKDFFVQADDLQGMTTIICDDIVAYGGTFKGLGDVLKTKNCGNLILFTSHADCEVGLANMVKYFDAVYTSNSKQNWDKLVKGVFCLHVTL